MDLLRELFDEQKRLLDYFFQSIDLEEAHRALETLFACSGAVVLTGVGKSGRIAEKISATLLSTGTLSHFLCPSNALHGDIGMIGSQDVFIAISKSGQSQELLDLLPYVEKKGAKTLAIVSMLDSKLEKSCSQVVHIPVLRELCPFDLAPTTSAAAQLIFGDILAIALMRKRSFSITDFAANHPAGFLGRKITFRVRDLMLKNDALPICRGSDKLIDALHELSAKKCGCLIIVDEQSQLLGIFTDGDLRRSIQTKGPATLDISLEQLMTTSPKSIDADRMAIEAAQIMEEDHSRLVTVLPVLQDRKVVGLIRMHDIVQAGLH